MVDNKVSNELGELENEIKNLINKYNQTCMDNGIVECNLKLVSESDQNDNWYDSGCSEEWSDSGCSF